MKQEILNYARGLNASNIIIKWIKNLDDIKNQSEIEHIIDFLIHKDFDNLSWASYNLLLEKSKKWIKQLSQNVARIDEEYGEDIEQVLDFEDGFKFVKLLSEKSYRREGALMSHCVASYYDRGVEIYSLRDEFNKPHCTIEKDTQIKGKGNGSIHPKYIDYVVQFLEWTGMIVRDNEMKNLGYIVPEFKDYVVNTLYKNRYVKDNEEIIYKDNVIVFKDLQESCSYSGDKICLYAGDANFRNSQITDLGQLQSIGGYADFGDSQITDLGQLQSIGGGANFSDSQIKLKKQYKRLIQLV